MSTEKLNRIADVIVGGLFVLSSLLVAVMCIRVGRAKRNG